MSKVNNGSCKIVEALFLVLFVSSETQYYLLSQD